MMVSLSKIAPYQYFHKDPQNKKAIKNTRFHTFLLDVVSPIS